MWDEAHAFGLECVVRVSRVGRPRACARTTSIRRSSSSPSAEDADDDPLTVLLELLHDVPAGKLAIAELHDATPEDVSELERSGVDAVLVVAGRSRGARSRPSRPTSERGSGMRIGILTGGGDCPGLNAVIRAVVRRSTDRGHEMVARPRRLEGPHRGRSSRRSGGARSRASSRAAARSSARRAPTRTRSRAASRRCCGTSARQRLDALVAIGGEDTLGVAGAPAPRARRSRSSASRRRSTTTSRARTTRSASTRPSRSRPRRSTGCTRPPSRTTA